MTNSTAEIKKFLDACYDAGIKKPIWFLLSKRIQVYDWLMGCFPRNCLPTDVDGEIEINGKFLRFEFKHEQVLRDGNLPEGQLKCFTRLVDTGFFTVFIIGTTDESEPSCIRIIGSKGIQPLTNANKKDIKELCRKWVKTVEASSV